MLAKEVRSLYESVGRGVAGSVTDGVNVSGEALRTVGTTSRSTVISFDTCAAAGSIEAAASSDIISLLVMARMDSGE